VTASRTHIPQGTTVVPEAHVGRLVYRFIDLNEER